MASHVNSKSTVCWFIFVRLELRSLACSTFVAISTGSEVILTNVLALCSHKLTTVPSSAREPRGACLAQSDMALSLRITSSSQTKVSPSQGERARESIMIDWLRQQLDPTNDPQLVQWYPLRIQPIKLELCSYVF